jgi:tRNA(Ile)-lysidine synthase
MESPLPEAIEVLERRLDASSDAPIAVAFSGGGDSLALLLVARDFAERCGRPLVVLHVDHGLQAASPIWADAAERTALSCGARFERLSWTGEKPQTGVPATARVARHRLIAEAARRLGAPVVLVGHTLDDQRENALMRALGVRVGVLREWSPSPVWPEGRGVFLCRPLLGSRRADLRQWLGSAGYRWFDDPANDDQRHPRVRARHALAAGAEPPVVAQARADPPSDVWQVEPWGGVSLDRSYLTRAGAETALRLMQLAVACAAGSEHLPRPARAERPLARIRAGEAFTATLGGARVEAQADTVVLEREAGETARGGLQPVALDPTTPSVWDGRFECLPGRRGLMVEALRGQGARLDAGDRAVVRAIPASARPALPLWRNLDEPGAPPRLALGAPQAHLKDYGVRCRSLCEARLAAAVGVVTREAHIGTIAHMAH